MNPFDFNATLFLLSSSINSEDEISSTSTSVTGDSVAKKKKTTPAISGE